MDIDEALKHYPHKITIAKIVMAGLNGYGRRHTYIARLDALCNVCIRCNTNDLEGYSNDECQHTWAKGNVNIATEIAHDTNELPEWATMAE